MKYLGIDYGKKNIGLAISDSAGKVAMPFGILNNNQNFLQKLSQLLITEKIDKIVIGLSLNLDGEENPLAQDINKLIGFLKKQDRNLKIYLQDERYSTLAAKWGTKKQIRRPKKKSKAKFLKKRLMIKLQL